MRAIIVDDEAQGTAVLKKMLEINCPDVEIITTCANADEAEKAIDITKPDLVFLDISMPGRSGIQMLTEMDEIPFYVIFVTAYEQYMLQAIRLSALDYLLKPVHEDDLIAAVAKVEAALDSRIISDQLELLKHNMHASQSDLKISIPSSDGFIIKKIDDIVYCEADNNYTKIFLTDQSWYLVAKSLSYYDAILSENGFVRIHKSHLINLKYVLSFSKSDGGIVTMEGGRKLEVSKRKREVFLSEVKKIIINK